MKSGFLNVLLALSLSFHGLMAQDWVLVDIGITKVEPLVEENGDTITFAAGGRGLRSEDELSFLYVENGIGNQLTVEVQEIAALGKRPQAGIMWRSGLDATAQTCAVSIFSGKLYLTKRESDGGTIGRKILKKTLNGDELLRLAWDEGKINFLMSANGGQTWEMLASEVVGEEGVMGLFATSGQRKVAGNTIFSKVSFEPVGLVDAWASINLQPSGNTAFGISYYDPENRLFEVEGSGTGFSKKVDNFHYIFVEVAEGADFELSARLAAFASPNKNATGVLSVRGELERKAASVTLGLRGDGKIRLIARSESQVSGTSSIKAKGQSAPLWFKLAKEGATVSSHYSIDGENWTLAGEDEMTFTGNYFIGFGGASADRDNVLPMSFDHVSITLSDSDLLEDEDGDFLSDAWELEQFGTLAYEGSDDFDQDGFTNLQEFLLGTDAGNADSDGDGVIDSLDAVPGFGSNGDSDLDHLPDTWEMRHFGNLDQDGSGDPDGDLVNNLIEYKQGRTPTAGAFPDTNNQTQLVLF